MDEIAMREQALEQCKRECDTISAEITRLLAEGRGVTEQERDSQNRRYEELMKRHGEAARRLLASTEALKRVKWTTAH
jgi:hypothetical protein